MIRARFIIALFFGLNMSVYAHPKGSHYSFIVMDEPAQLFTMRQFDESYLSLYRLLVRGLDGRVGKKTSIGIQSLLTSLLFIPITHEEGHRSILTSKNIGSISQPFFYDFEVGNRGAAFVIGVRNSELQNLRNTDLPTYIRLHTSGLESDYNLIIRAQTIYALGLDKKEMVLWDQVWRVFGTIFYFGSGAWPDLTSSTDRLNEETDELKRDIVGHDVFGAIRHLHRPTMKFFRYTKYDDLTVEEKAFGRRVGHRGLLNIINPLLIKYLQWQRSDHLLLSFGLGYAMSPFGDFIDENVWIARKNLRFHIYLRQFENKSHWFWSGGLQIIDFAIGEYFTFSTGAHFWNQPVNLNFNTPVGELGGAIDLLVKLRFFKLNKNNGEKYLTLDLGTTAKTKGFLPEEMSLEKSFSMRLGTSLFFK